MIEYILLICFYSYVLLLKKFYNVSKTKKKKLQVDALNNLCNGKFTKLIVLV